MAFVIAGIAVLLWMVYIFQLANFYKDWKKALSLSGSNSAQNAFEGISVVIAARNEESSVEACLKSLEQQFLEKNFFEVIVVDDHSEDHTTNKILSFSKNHPELVVKILALEGDALGKKSALQLGIKNARFPIIAITDADCWVPPQWLAKIRDYFVDREIGVLCGPVLLRDGKNSWLSTFQKLDFATTQLINGGAAYQHHFHLGNAANLSFKKSIFGEDTAYFNLKTASGDDVFLLEAMEAKSPESIYYAPERNFAVWTKEETTWEGFINQRLRWASKNKYYKNPKLQLTQAIVLAVNLWQLLLLLGSVIGLGSGWEYSFWILLFVKISVDYFIVRSAVQYYQKQEVSFFTFLGFSFLYAYYIVKVGVQSFLIRKYHWKGRVLK
jgi:glycosyltransferase involved in cell wall biosynthesis